MFVLLVRYCLALRGRGTTMTDTQEDNKTRTLKQELKHEWKIFTTDCAFIFIINFFLITGLIISTWWWHHDFYVYTGRYKQYLTEQEQFFKKVGNYPYEVYQSFNELIGDEILHPAEYAPEFRSENY